MKLSGRDGFCVRKILLVRREQYISITMCFPFLCLTPQIFICLLFAFICYLFATLQTTKNLFQAKHAEGGNSAWGINGETGEIANMKDLGIWDCYSVKAQTFKTAIEVNSYIL